MEEKIKALFDYQRFFQNQRLEDMILDTEHRYHELGDDELELVSAAGDLYDMKKRVEKDNNYDDQNL